MRKIIGWFVLSLPIIALVVVSAKDGGLLKTILALVITATVCACFIVGANLIMNDKVK